MKSRAARMLGANRQMLVKLVVVAGLMFGFGYALVPMYRAICDALGINVLSLSEQRVSQGWLGGSKAKVGNTQVDASRLITVEFDANARGPWDFKPEKSSVQVHPGELATVVYEFRNVQDRTMVAQALPSYAPMQAGAHFNKLECFCFTEQPLAAGESVEMPVVFFIDPAMDEDPNMKHIKEITLSYTFFPAKGPETPVAAAPAVTPDPSNRM